MDTWPRVDLENIGDLLLMPEKCQYVLVVVREVLETMRIIDRGLSGRVFSE